MKVSDHLWPFLVSELFLIFSQSYFFLFFIFFNICIFSSDAWKLQFGLMPEGVMLGSNSSSNIWLRSKWEGPFIYVSESFRVGTEKYMVWCLLCNDARRGCDIIYNSLADRFEENVVSIYVHFFCLVFAILRLTTTTWGCCQTLNWLVAAIGLPVDVHKCMTKSSLQLQCDPRGTAELQVHNSRCSWPMNYTVLSFMMNGQLTSSGLGLSASSRRWLAAEWSCFKVRETIKQKHTLKYLRKVLYIPLQ